ncbi:MAG: CopG family transcriptional regulator [Rhodospirillum sp.]|nr:CopG family transcriptional regulator [Rhodospirillum sp.]
MEEAKRLAIAEGLADIEAGRIISHEDMTAWLESWGTKHELPPPACK